MLCRSLCLLTSSSSSSFFFLQTCKSHPELEEWAITAHVLPFSKQRGCYLRQYFKFDKSLFGASCQYIIPTSSWLQPVIICLPMHLHVLLFSVSLSLLLFTFASVVTVEALSDRTDVWLSVHPDLSEDTFTLFQPLGPVQLWRHKHTESLKHSHTLSIPKPSRLCFTLKMCTLFIFKIGAFVCVYNHNLVNRLIPNPEWKIP